MAQRRLKIAVWSAAILAAAGLFLYGQEYPILEGSALYVYGLTSLQGATTVTTGGAAITGNSSVTGTLNVTGATDLDTTLNVDGATTQLGNVTIGKAATALTTTLGLGATSASSRTQLLDDIGSASVANIRYMLRVSNGSGTSYDQFNVGRTIFDDNDGTSFPSSHSWNLQCNDGLTSTPTWVTAMSVTGGDSSTAGQGNCETFYTRNVTIGGSSTLFISDGGRIQVDPVASNNGAALVGPGSGGDWHIDAMASANEWTWDGDSDDENDVTLDDADIGTDGGICIGGDTCTGPSWRVVSGNTAANDCPGTCVVGSLCSDSDGDGSAACLAATAECFIFSCRPANVWKALEF